MMRLDKFLSESSAYSRSEIRKLVKKNAVSVNGGIVKVPDLKVDEQAEITVNGERIRYRKYIYLMLNKPAGYLSATEDDRDPVVTELVPEEFQHYKPFPVGRLDKDTEGLLLLTNDGVFDHHLMSPNGCIFKRYYAELDKPAEPGDIALFAAGMEFPEFTAMPAKLEIDPENPQHVFVEIAEGKYHQVKRMCSRAGKEVIFLKRVAIGPLQLDSALPSGRMRPLTAAEIEMLEKI